VTVRGSWKRPLGAIFWSLCIFLVGWTAEAKLWFWSVTIGLLCIGKEAARAWFGSSVALETALKTLHASLSPREGERIRCGFLRPTAFSRWTKKLKKTVSVGEKGIDRSTRTIRFDTGTAGKAFIARQTQSVSFVAGDFYLQMEKWGFLPDEIPELQADRRAYISYPIIGHRDAAIGVLCVDSNMQDALTEVRQANIGSTAAVISGIPLEEG
jgi:hypothetical protein